MVKQLKSILILILMTIIFSINVIGNTGICQLDKIEYHYQDYITLRCSCTSSAENNREGYIVFKNNNGTILQSIATSSGICTSSYFGNTYLLTETINFNGTALFSLNSDGTGTPISWGDVGDISSVPFIYDNASITDCIITNIQVPSSVTLNQENTNVFRVRDATTQNYISGISCKAIAYSTNDVPILVEPYGKDLSFYRTTTEGRGVLLNTFYQKDFIVGNTYEFRLMCSCFNETGSICYDDTTGEQLGYKSCTTTGLFTVGADSKYNSMNSLYFILSLIFVLCIIGYVFKENGMYVFTGIVLILLGIELLNFTIEDVSKEITQGIAVSTCLIGIVMIILYAVRQFDERRKKKQIEDEIEIEFDKN